MKLLNIKNKLRDVPRSPGVYLFKDSQGNILYIGKAKSLRTRLASYFIDNVALWTVQMLQEEACDFEYFVTASEHSALILEAELVKNYKPKFNTLLKDGQPALYFLFTSYKNIPEFKIVRTRKEAGSYFGPFLNAKPVRALYRLLKQKLRLSLCNVKIPTGCLDFHIGICAGSCLDNFDLEAYKFRLKIAEEIVRGKTSSLDNLVEQQIKNAIEKFSFEEARELTEFKQHIDFIKKIVDENFSTNSISQDVAFRASSMSEQKISGLQMTEELQNFLELDFLPTKIDCFDISHFQSREIVGSAIRFVNCIPEKKSFRKFKIRSLFEQNDYAALAEIVQRRYRDGDYPDLIIIDGGLGQLNAVLPYLGSIPVASLAKREELLFMPNKIPKKLEPNGAGKVLLALRDYAHHFAITYHRSRRDRLA